MIYAVGDIHGQYKKLIVLLTRLEDHGMTAADTLVFVGDYVDRGPNVAGVLNTLIDLKATRPNTIFIRGNHEQMMLDARQRFDPKFDADNSCGNTESGQYWFTEGATETLKSYGPQTGRRWWELVPDGHWEFMRETQMEFHQHGYTFVHAGVVPPGKTWAWGDFAADPRLWIRYEFISSDSDFGGQTIIFGHTPTSSGKPLILKNKVALDTGAGYNGPLTGVGLPVPYDPSAVLVVQSL